MVVSCSKPVNPEETFKSGVTALNANKFDEAIDLFSKTVKAKPDHYMAYNNLGNAYMNKNNKEKAADAYNAALKIKPDSSEAYFNLGMVYANMKKYAEAADSFKKFSNLKPNESDGYHYQGVANMRLGKNLEGLELLQKANKMNPGDIKIQLQIGNCYLALNQVGKAEAMAKMLKVIDKKKGEKLEKQVAEFKQKAKK
jgi:protein O-GlcNAc transferase